MALVLRTPPDPSLWPADHAGEDVHAMDGVVFEDLLAVALERCGYGVELAGESVAVPAWSPPAAAGGGSSRRGARTAPSTARRSTRPSTEAPPTAAAPSLVVTTSVYTRGTIAYARQHGVTLWDQHDLADLLQAAALTRSAPPAAPDVPPLPPADDLRAEAGLRLDLPQSLDRGPMRGNRPLSGAGDRAWWWAGHPTGGARVLPDTLTGAAW